MPYKRNITPPPRPQATALTASMIGIGMNFVGCGDFEANLEDTLLWASELGMDEHDLRVLSILTTWFDLHHIHVNADRLVRIVRAHPSRRVRAYWSALARWKEKDRRFAKLIPYEGPRVEVLPVGTDFQISRRGEDERFTGSALRVPSGTLRDREADVLSPKDLVRRHSGYRNRVLMGPTWRADVWTVIERDPNISTTEAARRSYASFATAWQVYQDFQLLRAEGHEKVHTQIR